MNLPDSDMPGALALDRLIDAAAQELLMRSYTRRTLDRYKRVCSPACGDWRSQP